MDLRNVISRSAGLGRMNGGRKTAALLAFGAFALALSACGGSKSSTAATTTVTGVVFAAPISGAAVTVKDSSGVSVATGATGADGSYSVNVPDSALAGVITIEATGGTYTDEATGDTVTAGVMAANVAGGTLSSTANEAHLTPASTIVKQMVDGGKTLAAASADFEAAFGYAPDTTVKPVDPANPGADATDAQKLAGLHAAAFSQLVKDMGLPSDHQFDLMDALASDLGDGALDGAASGTAILISGHHPMNAGIQNEYAAAYVGVTGSATMNQTGLASDKIGTIPFATTAYSTTYKVEYVAGAMAAMQGKTTFQLKVSNATTGAAAGGLTLTLAPTMHMASMSHSTPFDGCAESATAGTYDCTIYYLMAGGAGMGYWELGVGIGSESVTFYPAVGMAMGDTAAGTLKNSNDTFTSMGTASTRIYKVFKDSFTMMNGMGTLKLFLAAEETLNNWPGLITGLSLNSGAFIVNTVTVEVSTDSGTTWTAMTEQATAGHFTLMNMAGLTSGTQATVLVRLTINGNVYAVDPTAATPVTYATMKLTPGSM